MKKHSHRWETSSLCGDTAGFSCRCGARENRKMTKSEHRQAKAYLADTWKHASKVNSLYHAVRSLLSSEDGNWKLKGYAAICKMDKFVKKHPAILEFGVDDSCATSSSVYIIPHCMAGDFSSVSLLYIPQCSGEDPIFLHMYPENISDVIKVLQSAKRAGQAVKHLPDAGISFPKFGFKPKG